MRLRTVAQAAGFAMLASVSLPSCKAFRGRGQSESTRAENENIPTLISNLSKENDTAGKILHLVHCKRADIGRWRREINDAIERINGDNYTSRGIRYDLAKALVYHYLDNRNWLALAELLQHSDASVREAAVETLIPVTESVRGMLSQYECNFIVPPYLDDIRPLDITPILGPLRSILESPDALLQVDYTRLATILARHYIRTENHQELVKLLVHRFPVVRSAAFGTIASSGSTTDESILNVITNAIVKDEDQAVRAQAIRALQSIAGPFGINPNLRHFSVIAAALNDQHAYVQETAQGLLLDALDSQLPDFARTAAQALVPYYIHARNWHKLGDLLKHNNPAVRSAVIQGIKQMD